MGIIDYGALTVDHLSVMLDQFMIVAGLDAQYQAHVDFPNDYAETDTPEFAFSDELNPPQAPTLTAIKVLVGPPMDGLLMSDFISLADKVQTQYTITTKQPVDVNDKMEITFTDGKKINVRVVEVLSDHPFATVAYNCTAVVT